MPARTLQPHTPRPTPQELQALIHYVQVNKASDTDWFTINPPTQGGTHWTGKCWCALLSRFRVCALTAPNARYVHDLIKYEFDFQFDVPATYPATAPEIELPALEGKTAKMYRGGKICLTIHFKPLWSKNRYTCIWGVLVYLGVLVPCRMECTVC